MPNVSELHGSGRGRQTPESLAAPGVAVGQLFAIKAALENSDVEKQLKQKQLASFDENLKLDQALKQTQIQGQTLGNQMSQFNLDRAPVKAGKEDTQFDLASQLAKAQIENENLAIDDKKVKSYRESVLFPVYKEQLQTQVDGARSTIDLNKRAATRYDEELSLRKQQFNVEKDAQKRQEVMQTYDRLSQAFFGGDTGQQAQILEMNKDNPLLQNLKPGVSQRQGMDLIEKNAQEVVRSRPGTYNSEQIEDARHVLGMIYDHKLGVPGNFGQFATPEEIGNSKARNSKAYENMLNVQNSAKTKQGSQSTTENPEKLPEISTKAEASKLPPGTRFWDKNAKVVRIVPQSGK